MLPQLSWGEVVSVLLPGLALFIDFLLVGWHECGTVF